MVNDMSLIRYITLIGADDKTVFIGSGSGYFFVGTCSEFLRDVKKIDEALARTQMKRKGRQEKCRRRDDAGGKEREYIPLEERSVVDHYPRLQMDGYSIIVEGEETGRFWTKNEFDTAMAEAGGDYFKAMGEKRPR